jgi:hypothetical protein
MNTAIPRYLPSVPGACAPAPKISEPPVHLPQLLVSLVLVVAVFDFCFWDVKGMGLSVAVFFTISTGIFLAHCKNTTPQRTLWFLVALLAGAVLATAIESGVTNTFVLLILTIAVAGENSFGQIDSSWGR